MRHPATVLEQIIERFPQDKFYRRNRGKGVGTRVSSVLRRAIPSVPMKMRHPPPVI